LTDPPPTSPTAFGPYRVIGHVGKGGMGVVYRCRHAVTDLEVAVKTVPPDDPADVASIRREIHALTQLSHPNIVRVLDQGVADAFPWYAMELVPGRTLRAALEADRDLRASLRALVDVCQGLAYMHGHGVVHRDLKPENILVRPDGSAVIVDFGIASAFAADHGREALASLVRSAGTALYMSPEQVLGQVVDPRADLYSLGCILYECLTGRPPFHTGDVLAIAWRQVNDPPPPPSSLTPNVPPTLEDLCLRLLQKRPPDRPGYADTVVAALARHLDLPTATRPTAPAFLYRPQLFGRRGPLGRAAERVREARAGHGGIVLVTGESGVGKTRLVVEAAAAASAHSVQVLSGACMGVDARREADVRAAPFHPLAALFTSLADVCRADAAMTERLLGARGRVLAEYAPELADTVTRAELPALPTLSPRAARDRALDAVRDTVLALAAVDPLLLVLDDLQWADELTMEFLARLADAELEGHRLLVLGTWRSEETTPALEALASQPTVETLRLTRLDRRAVRDMVRDMLAIDEVPDALASFVYEQSDGNPFFVAEYLRSAAAEAVLTRDEEGRWRLQLPADAGDESADGALGSVPQPRSIGELLQRRVTGLGDDAARALRFAAVLGREFDGEALAATADLDEAQCLDALHELHAREIVEEGRGDRLRFIHDRLREAAYASIPRDELPALHRRAADELERRGVAPPDAGAVAWHFARAGDHPRAGRYFTLAGDHARAAWAAREAIEHYQNAIEHLAATSAAGDDAPRLRERVADLDELLARDEQARAGFERCLTEVDARRTAWRARLHRKRAKTYETQHNHVEAQRAYDDAMAALGDAPPAVGEVGGGPDHPAGAAAWWSEWVQVQIERVWVHYWRAQPTEMRALIERVAPVVEARGTAAQRSRFYQAIVHSDLRQNRFRIDARLVTHSKRMVTAALETGDPTTIAYARLGDGMVALFDGRIGEARDQLATACEATQLTGDLTTRLRALTYLMVAARVEGDDPEASAVAARVLALATQLRMDDYRGAARATLGWVAWRAGDRERAEEETRGALSLWAALSAKYAYPLGWLARLVDAAMRHELGDDDAATEALAAVLDPTQVRLPEPLESVTFAALNAAPTERAAALRKVVSSAREVGYL
jgi:predicted Ser/Thr protein kinase